MTVLDRVATAGRLGLRSRAVVVLVIEFVGLVADLDHGLHAGPVSNEPPKGRTSR